MRSAILALAALLFAASATAQTAGARPATAASVAPTESESSLFLPEPGFAELGALPSPLSARDLARSALLASGLGPEGSGPYIARIENFLAGLVSSAGPVTDPAARGEAALAYLHKNLLGAYAEDATTIDGILDGGRFNCVSSAVLYLIACRALELDAAGVRTSDHAFCVLRLPGREIDVETTNPKGFDPGTKKEFRDSFGKVTGFAYVPPGGYGRREEIGERTLVGLILTNRASYLERSGRFREALRLGASLDFFWANRESREFLLDRVNNFEAALTRMRDFAGAARLVAAASAALGGEPRLVELARIAAYNRAAALGESGRWGEALDAAALLLDAGRPDPELVSLVEACLSNLVNDSIRARDFAGARAAIEARKGLAGAKAADALAARVSEAELAAAVNSLPFREALATAEGLLAAGSVTRAKWAEALGVLYGNEAGRLGMGGDWLAAAALAEEGARRSPADGSLARLAATSRRNFAVLAHNRFVQAYNARDYAGARAAIEEALAKLPGDKTLLEDLAAAMRALNR